MARFQNDIDAEIAAAEARLAHLYSEREKVPAVPKEPGAGAVIKFDVQHDIDGSVYLYSAYRIAGRGWYLSGFAHTGRVLSWRDILDLMAKDVSVKSGVRKLSFQIVDKWKTVTP